MRENCVLSSELNTILLCSALLCSALLCSTPRNAMSTTEADTASTVAATCGDSIESSAGVEVEANVDVDVETHTGDNATSAAQPEETNTNTNTANATATATAEAPSFVAQLLQSAPSASELAAQLQTDPAVAAFAAFHDSLKDNNEDGDKRDSSLDNAANFPKYNWDALSAAFEHVYTLYADEVAAVLADVDRLDIRRAIWHESAFRMDGERASRLFKNTEAWVASSEAHLIHQREGLAASVKTIRNTLADLSK